MASLRSATERSLLAAATGAEQHRLVEIQAARPAGKRLALLAVHAAVMRYPDLAARQLGMQFMQINEGRQSIVYRPVGEQTVVKIIKEEDAAGRMRPFTPRQRKNTAARLQDEHATLAAYVGRPVVPHQVSVNAHPLDKERQAILIEQPYKQLDFLILSDEEPTLLPLRQRLQDAREINPAAIAELSGVISTAAAMYHDSGLVLDIVGTDNVGLDATTKSLAIIDSQPVPTDRPDDQLLALKHMRRLEAALATL